MIMTWHFLSKFGIIVFVSLSLLQELSSFWLRHMPISDPFKYNLPVCPNYQNMLEMKNKTSWNDHGHKISKLAKDTVQRLQPLIIIDPVIDVNGFIVETCPHIVNHFSLFKNYHDPSNTLLPMNSTITNMCMLYILKDAFNKSGLDWMIWGGSMLGYLNHGNPVPWDEDIDIIIDMAKMDEICDIVGKYANSSGLMRCATFVTKAHFVSKIFFSFATPVRGKTISYPYLDVFGFNIKSEQINNVNTEIFYETLRGEHWWNIPVLNVFPVAWNFFGGDLFPFARLLSKGFLDTFVNNNRRYSSDRCHLGTWDHRNEVARADVEFDCCQLTEIFHFKKSFCIGKEHYLEVVMIGLKTIYLVLSSSTANPIVYYRHNFNVTKFRADIGQYTVVEDKNLQNLLCHFGSQNFYFPLSHKEIAGIKLTTSISNYTEATSDIRLGGEIVAFPEKLRSAWKGKSSLIFGAILCGEHMIIDEWLDHHISEGVDLFILVDNCNLKKDQDNLKPYIDKGLVYLIVAPMKHAQLEIYNKIIFPIAKYVSSSSAWLVVGDLDEFYYSVFPKSTLKNDLNSKFKSCSSVVIPQIRFGTNGHVKQPPSVIYANTKRELVGEEDLNGIVTVNASAPSLKYLFYVKTIYWIESTAALGIHGGGCGQACAPFLSSENKIVKASHYKKGKKIVCSNINVTNDFFTRSIIRMNHYRLQSEEFFTIKSLRGDVHTTKRENMRDGVYFSREDNESSVVNDFTLKLKTLTRRNSNP